MLTPSPDAVARTLAGRDAIRLQPSGAYVANLLGLSTQIPMKIIYFTDGRSRKAEGSSFFTSVKNEDLTLRVLLNLFLSEPLEQQI